MNTLFTQEYCNAHGMTYDAATFALFPAIPAGSKSWGYLTYRANDVVLTKDATLRVPFKVHDGWGEVTITVDVAVKKTPDVRAPRR